jgi:predicted nucleic acid-binding protein
MDCTGYFETHVECGRECVDGESGRRGECDLLQIDATVVPSTADHESIVCAVGLAPLNNQEAWTTYATLRANPRVVWAEEPSGLEPAWQAFALRATASPKLWMDAYLAAFTVAGGWKLATADAGFVQFKGLDVVLIS